MKILTILFEFLKKINNKDISQVICLGDLVNNGIAKVIVKHNIPTHLIWGNNDGGVVNVTKTFLEAGCTVSPTVFDIVEFGGRKIFLTHYSNIAKSMAKSGDYDAVFYGHNHEKNMEQIGDCLLLNPGEVSSHKTHTCTYSIYDTESNTAEIYNLEHPSNTRTKETGKYIKNLGFEFNRSKSHKI